METMTRINKTLASISELIEATLAKTPREIKVIVGEKILIQPSVAKLKQLQSDVAEQKIRLRSYGVYHSYTMELEEVKTNK